MKRYECDIAVIAAGPAGLTAAVTAAEKGASVVVLEKSNTTGGAANMGMGPLGVETEIQRENLIDISREQAFRKFMDYTHWRTDARLVREYIWKSQTHKWLQDMGVEFRRISLFPQSEANGISKSESGMGPRAAAMMKIPLRAKARS